MTVKMKTPARGGQHRVLTLIIFWLVFVGSENLDGGEPLHPVLPSEGLMFICVNCTHFHNILQEQRRNVFFCQLQQIPQGPVI